MVPYFLGLPLNLGYTFIVGSVIFLFIILISGFSVIKLAALILCVALLYVILTVLSHQKTSAITKRFFSDKLNAIKNNSLKPFKINGNNN